MSRSFDFSVHFGSCLVALLLAVGCDSGPNGNGLFSGGSTYTVEVTDYRPPPPADDGLVDDRLEDKHNDFDPELVDRRPQDGWLINQSEAVVKLDVPLANPDWDKELLGLHPSYAAALKRGESPHQTSKPFLPSVNLLDGKAKQFDDGLYAALDQAYFRGLNDRMASHVSLVKRLLERVGPDSKAAPFLAAGLKLAKQDATATDTADRDRWLQKFMQDEVASKPISFYTWTETLQDCWRFMRFFQQRIRGTDPVAGSIVAALASDAELLADCRKAVDFYSRLSNPPDGLSFVDLAENLDRTGAKPLDAARLAELQRELGLSLAGVSLFPASTSRESELFNRLFRDGLPPSADLMRELVQRIRSGQVDLAPRENSGWYDHQVFALETLLLAEKGEEHNKLLLTKSYKKRMLEAFKALITKRRETHARQMGPTAAAAEAPMEPPPAISPRLRVEPCPSYYLRTARAYAFLLNFLEAAIGDESLAALHGLRQSGDREQDLATELPWMRDFFYGLYLVSCEDIGHKPTLADGEVDSPDRCYELALEWLAKPLDDADLAADTRVSIPLVVDFERRVTRLWVTIGVRLTRLDASFVTPPRLKPREAEGDWQLVAQDTLRPTQYLIPVDEFAEVEIPGIVSLTREELRALCDKAKTKEQIIAALQGL